MFKSYLLHIMSENKKKGIVGIIIEAHISMPVDAEIN